MLSCHSDICRILLISLFFTSFPLSHLFPIFLPFSFILSLFFRACVYADIPKQKEFTPFSRIVEKIVAWVESSTVHFKAFHSKIGSGACFHATILSASKCLSAFVLLKECIMLWELQIGLAERGLVCKDLKAPSVWEATTSGKQYIFWLTWSSFLIKSGVKQEHPWLT